MLATSREPLAIDGERVYRIPALHVPDEGLETAQVLGAYDAVRLFADRAALHQQRFTLDDQNAVVVARICRSVDGLPLGIEPLHGSPCYPLSRSTGDLTSASRS